MIRRGGVAVLALVLVACTGEGGAAVPSSSSSTTSLVTTTTTTTQAPPETFLSEDIPLLAVYLASLAEGLEGTAYEGEVYADPEPFITTGRLFCELMDEGLSARDVLSAYVAALATGGGDIPADDLALGGVMLGASITVICPDYLDQLDDL